MDDNHCGQCCHWHELPPDPNKLGQPRDGECREGPPSLSVIPTREGLINMTAFPKPAATFPACSHFAAALVMSDVDGNEVSQ